MTNSHLARLTRISMSIVVMILAVASAQPLAASAADNEQCTQDSTPNLHVLVMGTSLRGPYVFASVRTDGSGTPFGSVVYRSGSARLMRMDIHKAFIKDDVQTTSAESSNATTVGVGLRGLGYLQGGQVVRVHVDIQDVHSFLGKDLMRIRWRNLDDHELATSQVAEDDCNATWIYDSGWFPVAPVLVYQSQFNWKPSF